MSARDAPIKKHPRLQWELQTEGAMGGLAFSVLALLQDVFRCCFITGVNSGSFDIGGRVADAGLESKLQTSLQAVQDHAAVGINVPGTLQVTHVDWDLFRGESHAGDGGCTISGNCGPALGNVPLGTHPNFTQEGDVCLAAAEVPFLTIVWSLPIVI